MKTIIFDIGNVIVSFDHRRIAEKLEYLPGNLNSDPAAVPISPPLVRDYNLGRVTTKQFFDLIAGGLEPTMSFDYFCGAWNSTFGPDPLVPEKFMQRLSRDFRLLALSDTNELHFRYLRDNFPILSFFDDFILSFEVGLLKPSLQIFEVALEKSNCSPGECLFIDDLETNVEGAINAGLMALRFSSFPQLEDQLLPMLSRRN